MNPRMKRALRLSLLAVSSAALAMHALCFGSVITEQTTSSMPVGSPTMKAAVIHAFGGPDAFKLEDVPRPEPQNGQVLIRVIAAGVNPVDAAVREGYFTSISGEKFPLIIGYDVAGVVEKVGSSVTKVKAGDPVYAYLNLKNGAGYAEFALAGENEVSPKPKTLSYEQAAAVPLAASTAWEALVEIANVNAGQTVLIHGGSGGVGTFAIQIAKARGATVIATASSSNQELLKQLGADEAIDYTERKFENVAQDVDVVLDTVGRDTLTRSYDVVKKGGIIVTIAGDLDKAALEAHGIRGQDIVVRPDAAVLAEITKLIETKKLAPVLSQVLALSDVAKAHQMMSSRRTRGKIVLRVAPDPQS
jgi:NADPH:quinone reductase-like Zn-dependent oxidoreductase